MSDTPSSDKIAQNYTAMGHSVDLLNAGKPSLMSDDDWNIIKASNVEHLELMVAKDYWTDEDMTAVNKAIADNK
jgi:hypothetical protein